MDGSEDAAAADAATETAATPRRGKAAKAGDQATGIVAKGRTILADRYYGPGEEVMLPADEIESLRARGVLVDPDAPPAPTAIGPTFSAG